MTPLWIELEGIRSFTTQRRIEFSDLELFAVLGDTGAGKSSILEAIVYALFNGTTWDGQKVKELMSTGASRMRVRFCFSLNGRVYTVSRSTPSEGASNHLLECANDPEARRDGERAVGAKIEELLGVDRDTFIKTVILPQGEFAELLTLSTARRTKLLTDILGLNVIDDMVRALAGPRERARELAARLRGERSRLPADPAAAVAAAKAENECASKLHGSLSAALSELKRHATLLSSLEAGMRIREEQQRRLGAADAAQRALAALCEPAEALQHEMKTAEAAHTAADAKLRAANAEMERLSREGRDAALLSGTHEAIGQLIAVVTERRREVHEVERRRANLNAARDELSVATDALRAAEIERGAARDAAVEAKGLLSTSSATLQIAERTLSHVVVCRVAAARANTALQELRTAAALAADAANRAQQEQLDTNTVLLAAKNELAKIQRANAAAHACIGLGPGDPCPVCERTLQESFKPRAAPDMVRAEAQERVASEKARRTDAALAGATAIAEERLRAMETAGREQDACASALDGALRAAREAGIDPEVEGGEASLTAIRAQVAEASDRARRAEEASLVCASAAAEAAAAHRASTLNCKQRASEVTDGEAAIAQCDKRIALLREQVPKAHRPAKGSAEAELSALRAGLMEAIDRARAFDAARTQAALDAKAAADALRALDFRQEREIGGPRRAACTHLAHVAETLAVLDPLLEGLTNPPSGPLADVAAWGQGVAETAARTCRTLGAEQKHDAKARSGCEGAIAKVLSSFEAETIQGLEAKSISAFQTATLAANALVRIGRESEEAAEIDRRFNVIEPIERALNALQAALGDAKFKHFVAARKENDLLGVATTILGRMTGERYGFATGLRIVDRSAGQERSTQTLSGGEKFLASLALALALVEIAARSGGRFGSLFLDEGFGTLDPHALDGALSELERQSAAGRLIGVITHVREVTEYIDDVLKVVKTPSGSDVRRLDRSEIDGVTEGAVLTALEARSAVSE